MTIATTDNKVTYEGNGTQTEFGFGFKIFDPEDIEVYTLNTENGDTANLELNTDYTVSATNNDYSNGGIVTLSSAPSATYNVVIIRRVDIIQEVDSSTVETVNPQTTENALDRLTVICQQLYEELARCVRTPVTEDTGLVLPPAVNRANKYLAFDDDGSPIVALTPSGMSLIAGSALAYVGDFSESWPTKRPDGVTTLTNDDSGRIALDIGNNRSRFAVYRHGSGETISDSWVILGTVQDGQLVLSGSVPMLAFTDSDETDPNGRVRFAFDGNIMRLQRKTASDPETWVDVWTVNQSTGAFGGLAAATESGQPVRFDEAVLTSGDQDVAGVKTFSDGIDNGGNRLSGISEPVDDDDAATKQFVDDITDCTIITFSRDMSLAAGSVDITCGFTPRRVEFYASIETAPSSIGFDDGVSSYVHYNDYNGYKRIATGSSIFILISGTPVWTKGVITSLNETGFTISWTKYGVPTGTVSVIARCYK